MFSQDYVKMHIIDVAVYGNNMISTVFDTSSNFMTEGGRLKTVKLMQTKLTIQDEEYGK
jgi:hypothetical protein